MLKAVVSIAIVGGVIVAAYWALLYFAQRSMLFPMPPVASAPPRPAFAEQIWLTTSFGRIESWYLPPIGSTGPSPVLVFTHGNGELIDYWPEEFEEPRRWGVGVLLVEYPGYGRSQGSPSESSITEAVLAAYDWAARQQPRVDSSRIIPYGRSLGGGAAVVLSRARPVPAVILESAFSSVSAFAAGFGAPAFMIRDKFDSVSALKTFKGPVLILHGDRDTIVPPHHANALAAAAANASLTFLPCGHNDCPRPWAIVRTFLNEHRLVDQMR